MSLADPPPAARIPEPETDGLPPLPLPAPRPGVRLLYPRHQRYKKDHRGGKIYFKRLTLNPLAPRDCAETDGLPPLPLSAPRPGVRLLYP